MSSGRTCETWKVELELDAHQGQLLSLSLSLSPANDNDDNEMEMCAFIRCPLLCQRYRANKTAKPSTSMTTIERERRRLRRFRLFCGKSARERMLTHHAPCSFPKPPLLPRSFVPPPLFRSISHNSIKSPLRASFLLPSFPIAKEATRRLPLPSFPEFRFPQPQVVQCPRAELNLFLLPQYSLSDTKFWFCSAAALYRVVQLDFTPEIDVFNMPL